MGSRICRISRGVHFWSIYQRLDTLSIDFEGPKSDEMWRVLQLQSRENVIFHAFGVPPAAGPQGVLMFSSGYYLESSMTSAHRNRCIECPDASKTIGNQLPMKKYIGAVLRKSFQLELVAEIGPFENPLPAQKNQRKYIEKLPLKKNKTIWKLAETAKYIVFLQ